MKKRSKDSNPSIKKNRQKGWLFFLVLAWLPSSTPFFFSEGFSQEDIGVYNESGTGAAGTPNIPTPSSDSVNSKTFMKAVSKFKGEDFQIISEKGMEEKVESADSERRKAAAEELELHQKTVDSTNESRLKEFNDANKDLGKQGWRKVKSAGKAASAANLLKLKHDRKNWASEGAECLEAKSGLRAGEPPELWQNPFSVTEDKYANKRVGHAYTPKFQGAMLFKECQGFSNGEWDVLVGNKSSGTDTWVGSWHDMAQSSY